MASGGLDLYELDERVVVKVALTMEGLRAAHLLASDGVPVTLTGARAHTAALQCCRRRRCCCRRRRACARVRKHATGGPSGAGRSLRCTGLYSAHQIVTALAAGVNYAAPYLGRMNVGGVGWGAGWSCCPCLLAL